MTLQEKIESYKSGDTTHKTELIVRNQLACGFIVQKINETPGGWSALMDIDDPDVAQARELIVAVMGEVNFKLLVITQSLVKVLL